METGSGTATGPGHAQDGSDGAAEAGPEQPRGADTGAGAATGTGSTWTGLPPRLLRMRRLLLVVWLVPATVAAGVLPGLFAGPAWAGCAALPGAALAAGWHLLVRNWRSWRYAERADDLLICRGVLWHRETVVPYGRMQLVEVTSGPVERRFGLAGVQLHTAAAATDARIPGLLLDEAERLRDRLTALGEARSAGL